MRWTMIRLKMIILKMTRVKVLREESGAITLFMVFMVLALLITFTGFMTYMTTSSMENEGARYTKVASQSLLANFDTHLRDYYGLMAYKAQLGEGMTTTIIQSCVDNNKDGFYSVGSGYQVIYMPLSDITDLDRLADDMESIALYKVSEEILAWAVDKVGLLKQVEKSGEVMAQQKALERAFESMHGTLESIYDQGQAIGIEYRGDYVRYLNRQMDYNKSQLANVNRLKSEVLKVRREIANYRDSIKRSAPEMLEEASKAMLKTCDSYVGILDSIEGELVRGYSGITLSLCSYRNLLEDNIAVLESLRESDHRWQKELAAYEGDNAIEWHSLTVDRRSQSNLLGQLKQIYDTMTFQGHDGLLDNPGKHNEKLLTERNLEEVILINEYLLGTLQCAMTSGPRAIEIFPKQEREAVMAKGEIEYILKGYASNRANAAAVSKDIFLIRVVMNNLHILSDQDKMKTVADLGVSLGGWTGLGVPIASFIIVEVWASSESALDVYDLLEGDGVAFFKLGGDWRLELNIKGGTVMDSGRGDSLPKDGENDGEAYTDFYYVDYLRLFLLAVDSEVKLNRFLDLLEADHALINGAVDLTSLINSHEIRFRYDYESWDNGILSIIDGRVKSNEVMLIDGY